MAQLLRVSPGTIIVAGFLLCTMTSPMPCNAAAGSGARLVLTSREFSRESEKQFSCHKPLFAYIDLPDQMQTGPHEVEVTWLRPDGKPQDRATTTVERRPGQRSAAGFRLQFHLPDSTWTSSGALFALPQHQSSPFDGRWTFQVHCDGKEIAQSYFDVLCPAGQTPVSAEEKSL